MALRETAWRCRVGVVAVAALLGAATPVAAGGGDDDWRQAVDLSGFGAVDLVVRPDLDASPPAAALLLEDRAGRTVHRFPPLPATGRYGYFATSDVALADIDGDGRDDVVVIVEVVTGIGPGGADPFRQAGVYLGRPDGFARDPALEEALNEPPGWHRWSDMPSLLRLLAEGG